MEQTFDERYDIGIVDGQNIFFKAFSTQGDLSVMIDFQEVKTGATFGFINSLITLKRNYLKSNSKIYVAWDRGYDRRSRIYPAYKQNRAKKEEWSEYGNFVLQRESLQQTLKILGIPQAYKDGEEADDIPGTLSSKHAALGHKILLMSADKDYQQLIQPSVDLLAHKGKGNIKVWNEETWEAEHGFHPSKFTYILAIQGDSGDNIPGVAGVGEVGAYNLVQHDFEVLEKILSNKRIMIDIPTKGPMKKLWEDQANYRLSYELALIDRHINGIKIHKGRKDMEQLETLFCLYQFNELMKSQNWKILEMI